MSEYQYYEFQAIDRPLTESDLEYLRTLSSRGYLTATSASFEYNYGDFRGNEDEILEEYFDALLYITNWGVRRLVFRFPKALINLEVIKLYTIPEVVTLRTTDRYAVLDIFMDKEEGEWVESGEGWLSRMIMLRDAILHGDYRALYLAWLRAVELNPPDYEEVDEDEYDDEDEYENDEVAATNLKSNTLEPPVPPNLSQLDGPLQAFVEFFEIDPQLVRAAAAASPTAAKASEPIEKWINALPEQECRALLLRVAKGEANMALQVIAVLRERFATSTAPVPGAAPRTVTELRESAEALTRRIFAEQQRQAEEARQQRLEKLAKREPAAWEQVMALISKKNASGYDEAVRLLVDLGELAAQRKQTPAFLARVEQIRAQFPTLSGLKSRLLTVGLIKK